MAGCFRSQWLSNRYKRREETMSFINEAASTLPRDAIARLEACSETEQLDAILDSIGFPKDLETRNYALMSHMGVLNAFCSNGEDIQDDIQLQYAMTKEVFVDGDWKYMNGRGHRGNE
jgi:hypothetical protein